MNQGNGRRVVNIIIKTVIQEQRQGGQRKQLPKKYQNEQERRPRQFPMCGENKFIRLAHFFIAQDIHFFFFFVFLFIGLPDTQTNKVDRRICKKVHTHQTSTSSGEHTVFLFDLLLQKTQERHIDDDDRDIHKNNNDKITTHHTNVRTKRDSITNAHIKTQSRKGSLVDRGVHINAGGTSSFYSVHNRTVREGR